MANFTLILVKVAAEVLAAGALVVGLGACSTGNSTHTPPDRSGRPVAAAHESHLTATLILPSTTVKRGTEIAGRIKVINDTGKALHLGGCGGLFQVLLTSRTYHPQPFWTDCLRSFTIPTGRWSERVQVRASFNQCSPRRATADFPKCRPNGQPALPRGHYLATVFDQGRKLPRAAPIPVTVTG